MHGFLLASLLIGPVPDEGAVVEVSVAAGVRVDIDGDAERLNDGDGVVSFVVDTLPPDRWTRRTLTVERGDEPDETRTLLLRRGVRCTIDTAVKAPPDRVLVPSDSHFHAWPYEISANGRWALTGEDEAVLWDVETGRVLRTFDAGEYGSHDARFLPDGRHVAVLSSDGVAVWDAVTGSRRHNFVGEVPGRGRTGVGAELALADDLRHVALGDRHGMIRRYDVLSGRLLGAFEGHEKEITSLAFSPDGRRLLSTSRDESAILWNAETEERLQTFSGWEGRLQRAVLSPDGSRILTTVEAPKSSLLDREQRVTLWDATNGRKVRRIRFVGNHAEFLPSGKFLTTSVTPRRSNADDATVWDAETGEPLHRFEEETRVHGVEVSPDGRRLVTDGWVSTGTVWDVETGRPLAKFAAQQGWRPSVRFSPDGRRFVTDSPDQDAAILWNAETGERIHVLGGHEGFSRKVAFSPDGRLLATITGNDDVFLWDVETGERLRVFRGAPASSWNVRFTRDGRYVVTGDDSLRGIAQRWAVDGDGDPVVVHRPSEIESLAFSPDGRRLLVGSNARPATVWDFEAGRRTRTFGSDGVWCHPTVQFSADGQRALTVAGELHGAMHDRAELWDVRTSRVLRVFEPEDGEVEDAALSPDGRFVLTGADETAILWDRETGERLRTYEAGQSRIRSVAFSRDGRLVLAASFNAPVAVWQRSTGRLVRKIEWPENSAYTVTVSPDGRTIAVGTTESWTFSGSFAIHGTPRDESALLFDARTGRVAGRLRGHVHEEWGEERFGSAVGVAYSPDGSAVLTVSYDDEAILFDVAAGAPLRRFRVPNHLVTAATFSPSGRHVATGDDDGIVRLWDVVTGEELARLHAFEGDDWLVTTPDGRYSGSAGGMARISFRERAGLHAISATEADPARHQPGLLAELLGDPVSPGHPGTRRLSIDPTSR